jgi:predicted Zn-dependent peptidase
MQIENQTVAGYALRIQTQAYQWFLWELHKNISAVTADDVLRVANKYFLENNRVVV